MSSAVINTEPGVTAPTDTAAYSADVAMRARDIDASMRLPVLLFFASSVSWLLLGSALATIAAFKLNVPGFLGGVSWLTFGRIHPCAANALLYGWEFPSAIGIGLWILARLGRAPLRHGSVLTAAWALWNFGVTLGLAAILYGQGTSFEGLEFPRYVSPILFTAFVFVAIWAVLLFSERHDKAAYISQWYALAAFLWFPWVYGTANLVIFFLPVQAAAQEIVAAWYLHNVVGTFLIPLALAAAYYMVPKATGEPIHRYRWAKLGFWLWMLFAGWGGAYRLIGGPVPAWILSVSISATVLSLIPTLIIYTNLRGSTRGRHAAMRLSPSFRFVATAVPCFLATMFFMALSSFRSVNAITHFTLLSVVGAQLAIYGFAGLIFFGGMYYIVPRLLGTEWESPKMIRVHFWLSFVGLGLAVVGCGLGGLVQGFGLDDPKIPIMVVLSFVKPFLVLQWVAITVMMMGHICLAASCILVTLRAVGAVLMPSTSSAAATSAGGLPSVS